MRIELSGSIRGAGRVSVYSPSRLRVVDNDAGKRVLTAA